MVPRRTLSRFPTFSAQRSRWVGRTYPAGRAARHGARRASFAAFPRYEGCDRPEPRCAIPFASPFSSTKHAPPSCLTQLIERGDLLTTIDRQRHKRLLVVQAPAGYGKTTLLAQWREAVLASGSPVAWIGLESPDRAPAGFVETLVSGLAHAGMDLPDAMTHPPQGRAPDEILEAILLRVERPSRETWLIFEDWHLVETEETAALLGRLLRRMPVNWHVALSSRSRPGLNLLALRAQGQLIEIGEDDLRFSPVETRALAATADLPVAAIAELSAITEGWPIALQLALAWLSHEGALDALRSSFIGSVDGMAEYLAAEVFAALPPELQDFLVESSICPRFDADLADVVRGRLDSAMLMASLATLHGLAIPLDRNRHWYRHHRIFAEFLDEARRRLPRQRLATLHANAATWFEREGLLLEAIGHARASGDDTRAANLLESAGCVDVCIRFGAPAAAALLDSVPADIVQARPRLRAAYAAMNLKRGSIAHASRILADLQAANSQPVDPALRRDLLIVRNLRHCFIDDLPSAESVAENRLALTSLNIADWWVAGLMHNVQGRLEVRRGLLKEATRSLSDADAIFERGGSVHGHFFMLANRAICQAMLGRLAAADLDLADARQVLIHGLENADSYAGVTSTIEAVLLYERNDLVAAGQAAHIALAALEQAEGCFEQYLLSTYVAARSTFAASGLEPALRTVDRGRRLARFHGLSRVDDLLDLLRLRLLIDAGRWDEAAASIDALAPAIRAGDPGWLESDLSVPILCLSGIHGGRPREARELAGEMAGRCREAGRTPAVIRACLLMALASAALGDRRAALDDLRDAVAAAAPERFFQPFLEVTSDLLALLHELRSTAIDLPAEHGEFLADLILRMVATAKARNHVDRLTARERDVLIHLRQGRSNKVIARSMNVTDNAVKFHMKNLFRKLGVDSRTMAAEVANRLPLS